MNRHLKTFRNIFVIILRNGGELWMRLMILVCQYHFGRMQYMGVCDTWAYAIRPYGFVDNYSADVLSKYSFTIFAFAFPTILSNVSKFASLMFFTDFNSNINFSAVCLPMPLMSFNSE